MQVSPHMRRGHERAFAAAAGAEAVIKAQVTATHLWLLNGRFKLTAAVRRRPLKRDLSPKRSPDILRRRSRPDAGRTPAIRSGALALPTHSEFSLLRFHRPKADDDCGCVEVGADQLRTRRRSTNGPLGSAATEGYDPLRLRTGACCAARWASRRSSRTWACRPGHRPRHQPVGRRCKPSPDTNSPVDCFLCLARGRATGPARPASGRSTGQQPSFKQPGDTSCGDRLRPKFWGVAKAPQTSGFTPGKLS